MARALGKREQEIIAHALTLFSEGGYRDTSLQEVADKLGITRQAFYYYFKSKDDLLWRLIGRLGDQLKENAEPVAASDDDPVNKLRKLIAAHVRTLVSNQEAWRIYFAERNVVSRAQDQKLRRGEDDYLNLIAGVISEGHKTRVFKAGKPRILALLVDGIANSVLRWYRPTGEIGVDEISRIVAEVAVDGLRVWPASAQLNWPARNSAVPLR